MENNSLLYEILAGVSLLKCDKKTFYFKHPTLFDKTKESVRFGEFRSAGAKIGLLSEESLLADAIKNKGWSKAEELETKELIKWIAKNEAQKGKISDPQILQGLQNTINSMEEELKTLQNKRSVIVNYSLENYTAKKVSVEVCIQDVFYDPKLTKRIKRSAVKDCFLEYNIKYYELSSYENLIKTAYDSRFFDLFALYEKDIPSIFGTNIYSLTIFQKDILSCAKTLLFKLQNVENIPARVKEDPLLLFKYSGKREEQGEQTNIRDYVDARGGADNMQAKDKVT